MPFVVKRYREQGLADYIAGRFSNNSTANVERTVARPHWAVAIIHHLTGDENRGNRNLFIDAYDMAGKRLYPRIEWGWAGMRPGQEPGPVILDKPDNEAAGNISIGANQLVWARVLGENSDKIFDVTTLLPDEDKWNTLGHHSHYVLFVKDERTDTPPPDPQPPTPDPTGCDELQEKYDELYARMLAIKKILEDV